MRMRRNVNYRQRRAVDLRRLSLRQLQTSHWQCFRDFVLLQEDGRTKPGRQNECLRVSSHRPGKRSGTPLLPQLRYYALLVQLRSSTRHRNSSWLLRRRVAWRATAFGHSRQALSMGLAARVLAESSRVRPNHSLKLSPNGMSRWPSSAGPAAHFALAVQRAMPLVPA